MNADLLITGISQLATADRRGTEVRRADARSERHRERRDGHHRRPLRVDRARGGLVRNSIAARSISAARAVVPGLVDPHTHAVWAGDRLRDFDARTSGVTYEQILAAGGGIWSTIRATTAASDDELISLAEQRIWALIRSGATVVEVKSGYGFTVAGELRLLEVIRALASRLPIRIVPTLLIHIPPNDRAASGTRISTGSKRADSGNRPTRSCAAAVDIFVEKEAWSADEAESVLTCALEHGSPHQDCMRSSFIRSAASNWACSSKLSASIISRPASRISTRSFATAQPSLRSCRVYRCILVSRKRPAAS